ncbi:hypothetical protein HYV50_00565 [Candidatus Pacearchaeota archaeon]|nr:hypothetical protein [Candidatus Pacearchaeota archaeon]
MTNAKIVAFGWYVPETVLDNAYFVALNPRRKYVGEDEYRQPKYEDGKEDMTNEKIIEISGIRERRKVAEHESVVDLIENAYRKTGFPAEELSGILIGTISNRQRFPSVGCRVQERIGAKNVSFAPDIAAACSGFTHSLEIARLRIKENGGYYLVGGVETLTRKVDYTERNCILFGDGCGLVVLGPTNSEDEGVRATIFDSIVSGISWIYEDSQGILRMTGGREVLKRATRGMIDNAHKLVRKAGIDKDAINKYIPHQANLRIIENIENRIDPEKSGRVYRNIERYGNMSAATVPIALAEAKERGDIKEGDLVVLVDMGSGLAFGGALIRI